MSTGPYRQGHRAQSARRYRQDAESFDGHAYPGDVDAFGGYAGVSAAPTPRTVTWNASSTWHSDPAAWQSGAAAPAVGSATWDAWGPAQVADAPDHPTSYGYPATDYVPIGAGGVDAGRVDAGWPRTDPGFGTTGTETPPPSRIAGRRTGAHRMPAPPAALKGRAAVVAVAAGAVVAAGQATMHSSTRHQAATTDYQADGQVHEVAPQAQATNVADPAAAPQTSQLVSPAPANDISQFSDILQHGQEFADDLAAQEDAKLRPVFAQFAYGTHTSNYGFRWGTLHAGVDIAAPIGTPIYSVEDGTVISAGPASGFGMWVRVQHDDGTITVYGHIDTATVSIGQRVLAGDQIATIGNRGFSTGPHCHFEVHPNGGGPIDPTPWLASRGISLGPETD